MGTHPIFESDFDCLTEMIRVSIIKRLTKKKNLKEVVYEKKKSDVILNEGRMFQIQSQLSTLCAISSAYAFYNAYLTDDIDGVLLDSEKIALEAAHFKFGVKHLAFSILFLPGSSLIFGRFLFRIKNFKNSNLVSRSRDILPDGNQGKRVIQFLSFSILLFISNISLDSKSIKWTETFDEGSSRRKLAEGLAIHPASDSFHYLPKLYQRLHGSTFYKVSNDNDLGILDQFGFLSQAQKINILFKIIHFRSFLLKISNFGN